MGSRPGKTGDLDEALFDLGYTPMIHTSEPWTVDKALQQVSDLPSVEASDSPVPFFHILERLKTTKREGWRRFGIERAESIADHMYRMSLISMFAPPSLAPKLNLPKCMKMCLIHDMAELLVGDITPVDGVPKSEKNRREAATMDYLTNNLLRGVAGGIHGEEIRAMWQEYEDSITLDSHYVHDVDKIELLLQMNEYERRSKCVVDLGEFARVASKVTLPEMREWADKLLKEREDLWGSKKHSDGTKGVQGGLSETKIQQQNDYYSRDGSIADADGASSSN